MTLRAFTSGDTHELAAVIGAHRNSKENREDLGRILQLDRSLESTGVHEPTDVLVTRPRNPQLACSGNEGTAYLRRRFVRPRETPEQLEQPVINTRC